MPVLLLCAFRFVRLLMGGHQAVAVENAAFTTAARCISAKTEATGSDGLRSDVLDCSSSLLVRLAYSIGAFIPAVLSMLWIVLGLGTVSVGPFFG